MGYKFWYYQGDYVQNPSWGRTEWGSVVFSKYPIIDSGKISFKEVVIPESMVYVDVDLAGEKVRLFTAHLVSLNLAKSQKYMDNQVANDSAFIARSSKFTKLKHYDSIHSLQAKTIHDAITKSPNPAIFSGDLNSVPSSYVYHTIKGSLQDAFLKKGFGLGRTYYTMSPTLRIDYMFVDPKLKIKQFTSPHIFLSDHFPLIADMSFK
jgi:endonuclease/exonuclease/phosphatase family metal-dependent hydrolase